jgi:hypothetical protein
MVPIRRSPVKSWLARRRRRSDRAEEKVMPPKPRPAAERFWAKVRKSDGCWEWLGARMANGYGRFLGDSRRVVLAHRFAYTMLVGEIPDGMVLDHLCRNPLREP